MANSTSGGEDWGRTLSSRTIDGYVSATAGAVAIGGVVGYVFAALYSFARPELKVDQIRVAEHCGFLAAFGVMVFVIMRLAGA